MDTLQGKRLLLLGSNLWKDDIKRFAKENGVYLIFAGLYPGILDEIADEYYRIDTTDPSVMIPFIKEHDIDGIFMGGSELIISKSCDYINQLGYPCYCTKSQWDVLQNKRAFKDYCKKYKVPTVPEYDICDKLQENNYPVIVKPIDSCASKGINVCAAKKAADTEKCAAANGDSTACKGVKSTAESLCTFTKGTEAHCKDAPVTFKELTIKLTSVKVKNVEVTIIPDNEDIDKKVTSDTIIENLQLSSGSSFTEDLTCKISTGSKLGTVICTMEKAATKDTKYKLIAKGESKVNLKGDDTFNGVKINDNEVTATEDNNNTNTDQGNSSYLKFSVFIALLVILF